MVTMSDPFGLEAQVMNSTWSTWIASGALVIALSITTAARAGDQYNSHHYSALRSAGGIHLYFGAPDLVPPRESGGASCRILSECAGRREQY